MTKEVSCWVPKKPPSWRCVKRAVATVTLVAVLVYCFTARRSSAPLGAWYGSAAKLGGLGKIVNDRKLNKSDLETLKRKEKVILDSVVAEVFVITAKTDYVLMLVVSFM